MKQIVQKYTAVIVAVFYVFTIGLVLYTAVEQPYHTKEVAGAALINLMGFALLLMYIGKKHRYERYKNGDLRAFKSELYPNVKFYKGLAEDYRRSGIERPVNEFVERAAMASYGGCIYSVDAPLGHIELRRWRNSVSNSPIASYGWITNMGRYITRAEAWRIASAAKQVTSSLDTDAEHLLTAEKLWPSSTLQQAA